MKFQMLPIGARFEYQGKVYVKTGPIAASSEEGGQRMIPRYATLRPLDGAMPAPQPRPPRMLDEVVVRAAMADFHAACARLLDEAVDDPERLARGRQALEEARGRCEAGLEAAAGKA